MLIEHIPLVVGVALFVAVHTAREKIGQPGPSDVWLRVIDTFLNYAGWILLISLVGGQTVELAVELWEKVVVLLESLGSGVSRIMNAFSRKRRQIPASEEKEVS